MEFKTVLTMKNIKPEKTFSVIYRKGGTLNFTWNKCTRRYSTKTEAQKMASQLEQLGYPSMIFDTNDLNTIGLPETYQLMSVSNKYRSYRDDK